MYCETCSSPLFSVKHVPCVLIRHVPNSVPSSVRYISSSAISVWLVARSIVLLGLFQLLLALGGLFQVLCVLLVLFQVTPILSNVPNDLLGLFQVQHVLAKYKT